MMHRGGVIYDSRDDLLDVALDRTDHLSCHPHEIVIEEGTAGGWMIARLLVDHSESIAPQAHLRSMV
jgi:hypothetical protein